MHVLYMYINCSMKKVQYAYKRPLFASCGASFSCLHSRKLRNINEWAHNSC